MAAITALLKLNPNDYRKLIISTCNVIIDTLENVKAKVITMTDEELSIEIQKYLNNSQEI